MVLSLEQEISDGLLLLRPLCYIVFAITLGTLFHPLAVSVVLVVIVLIAFFQPYKLKNQAKMDIIFYSLLGLFFASLSAFNIAATQAAKYKNLLLIICVLSIVLPLMYTMCLCLHWLYINRKWGRVFLIRVRAYRRGDEELDTDTLPDRMDNPHLYQSINQMEQQQY